jgi:hypothetical protein
VSGCWKHRRALQLFIVERTLNSFCSLKNTGLICVDIFTTTIQTKECMGCTQKNNHTNNYNIL